MQLKMFGPSGGPDEEFRKELRTLFDIAEEAWVDLAE
jgi:hypothetical protein